MFEAEWPGTVGVTEPRRISAVTLAGRVADETGTLVQGPTVGYSVRFDSCEGQPKIKVRYYHLDDTNHYSICKFILFLITFQYMTEGILLREMMADPLLNSYSAIMLDEVHERTLNTDILMGLLKKILRVRHVSKENIRKVMISNKTTLRIFLNKSKVNSSHTELDFF